MNLLVTGGAGFIGSNFIRLMLSTNEHMVVNLDSLTYAGNENNLNDLENGSNYKFIEGRIDNSELLEEIFQKYDIDQVIHFAAETHVDRSIKNPSLFVETNIIGTQILLETARKFWKLDQKNIDCTDFKKHTRFIQVSTDEVYGTLGKSGYFTEESNLAPNSPYSASKASADMLVRAYYETYGLPTIITRCSNNYGPFQYSEKLIPLVIQHALLDLPIPIYGDGKQVRDWLFVEDHCTAIAAVLHHGKIGEVYNIGGNNERENNEIVKFILTYLNKSEELLMYVDDRLGHDVRYAIDNTKITAEIGWSPRTSYEKGLTKTIDWYLENQDWLLKT
ncbi:dTDP-glucose 4,6-dehydratase [Sporosarcina oncorhynchi]|uniref:dTDP-glucose 4,6-dehydratase n=1 Tax=Sporosarcina oncorhynchi TaxID=3056444 RepID=A0ABZ0L582_9BACL|nr:dTDP-glucose 4,6-dehydratase [Sporosarcina sp. T2O-4]WOV86464.1 dTDP-glucose 4,6-dehydratase [Sporosarcina sp. T2O-4]